jgi:hypothetical protein
MGGQPQLGALFDDDLAVHTCFVMSRDVEVAAAWRGERGGGEEQQDESKEEAAGLPHPRILTRKDPTSHAAGPKPTCKISPFNVRFRG